MSGNCVTIPEYPKLNFTLNSFSDFWLKTDKYYMSIGNHAHNFIDFQAILNLYVHDYRWSLNIKMFMWVDIIGDVLNNR